jgi:hypothetical protein
MSHFDSIETYNRRQALQRTERELADKFERDKLRDALRAIGVIACREYNDAVQYGHLCDEIKRVVDQALSE